MDEELMTEEENKPVKQGKVFVLGLLTGILISAIGVVIFLLSRDVAYMMKLKKQENYAAQLEEKINPDGNSGEEEEQPKKQVNRDTIVTQDTITKMAAIERIIREYYYAEVDASDLSNGVYDGMMASIGDKYSDYYSPEELKEVRQDNAGLYGGIGAYVGTDKETNMVVITSVMPGTPAEEYGLHANDIIYKVDGVDVSKMTSSEVVKLIRGPENSFVTITVVREGESDYLDIDVERRIIESPTVKYEMLDDDIGYIQITEFDDVTADQFSEAITELNAMGMKALLLDLRSNPGGNLTTCCDIASQMLPEGLIVYTEDKYGNRDEYKCDGTKEFDKPLVVLVNGYSASASEILTGAIKDYGIGTIMGETTFGKGIVQRIIPLEDGSAVKLTVSRYFTPKGNYIHEVGIEPDIEVELDADRYLNDKYDSQKEAAIQHLKDELK